MNGLGFHTIFSRRYGYVDLVQQLLACPFVEPDPEELDALAR